MRPSRTFARPSSFRSSAARKRAGSYPSITSSPKWTRSCRGKNARFLPQEWALAPARTPSCGTESHEPPSQHAHTAR
jgi:hypothetical protein